MAHPLLPRGRTSRATLLLLVLAAAVLGVPAFTPAAGAADPLISQAKPVTASSTENVAFPASAAVDGNPGTRCRRPPPRRRTTASARTACRPRRST